MIICLRTVIVPPEVRDRYLAWIDFGRQTRQQHGILTELVCEPAHVTGETVVITVWPSHEVFDAWIATPHHTTPHHTATRSPPARSTVPSPTDRSRATTYPAAT
ncbi:MAG: antibiotic biosynthesis monooxygenase [Dermatophilaceae bacterium]